MPDAPFSHKPLKTDIKDLPQKRYTPPDASAFDFGTLIEERALVACARKKHRNPAYYVQMRKEARRRGLWVEHAGEMYEKAWWEEKRKASRAGRGRDDEDQDEEEDEEEQDAGEDDDAHLLVDSLVCALGYHQVPSKKPSLGAELVGMKW